MQLRELGRQLGANWRSMLTVHLIFVLLGVALLTPLFTALLHALVALSGEPAVADQDIALLLLTPVGLCSVVLLIAIALALAGLELGALQLVASAALANRRIAPLTATRHALANTLPLLQLTLLLTLRVLAWLLPAAALIGLVAWVFLTEHDINYYLAQRPPAFYFALGAAAPVVLVVIWQLGKRLLRWSLAMPLLLIAKLPAREALARSESLTAGNFTAVIRALLRWLLGAGLLLLIPVLFLDLATGLVTGSGSGSLATLALGLGVVALIWSALNVLVGALVLGAFCLVIAALYQALSPAQEQHPLERLLRDRLTPAGPALKPGRLMLAGTVVALLAAGSSALLLRNINTTDQVLVVAHRGAAGAAPENTLAAVRRALDDGADWVEIDVQETRDGEVVVVHDSDFMKLAGDPLKVWDGDLARIQAIDVGSWFDPEFSAERVPTLRRVLDEVRGRARLVIELKYYGHDQQLEQRVVDIVEDAGMAQEVAIMSLKLPGIKKIQALRPDWTAGLLAATAVGDLTRLDMDFLAVNANMANTAFIRRAHAADKQVFVWTINDALSLSRWMSAGVDGVITDEPALARDILRQRAELSTPERLLLSAALFFGRTDVAANYRDNSP